VAGQVARRIVRLLERSGLTPAADPAEPDPLRDKEPLLALLYSASVAGRIATGRRAGQRVLRVGDRIDVDDLPVLEGERCASVGGVSLHANVAVPARDRRRLERLCRYVARPPISTQRLSRLDDGRLLYRLKHRWRDGTTHVVFERRELLEKLVALVPPPRFHLVRYHGILGPCASERDRVVPGGQAAVAGAPACDAVDPPLPDAAGSAASSRARASSGRPPDSSDNEPVEAVPAPLPRPLEAPRSNRPRRLAWADLLRRVFAADVLECPRCGSRTRLLAAIHPPDTTRAILECLALPSRAPPADAARPDDDEEGAPRSMREAALDTGT
jgi:hypothetical protein